MDSLSMLDVGAAFEASRDADEDDLPLPGPLGRVPGKEFTFWDWVLQRQAEERRPFQPHWGEAIKRVATGEFPTLLSLGAAYGKRPAWASKLRDVAIGQRVFSAADWRACFSGRRKKRVHVCEPLTAQPSQQGGTPRLNREQFAAVFREKQDTLTVDLVVQLLRLGCWSSSREFAGHFRRPEWWAQAFRRFLMRELIMTAKEWRACWRCRRRREPEVSCSTTTGTTSFKH